MSDIVERPTDSNADAWALFLSEWLRVESGRVEGVSYVAVQIAEALDAYWREYLAERTARMEANSREFAAAAEIERLREALTEIEYLDRPQVRGQPRRVSIGDIARAALNKGEAVCAHEWVDATNRIVSDAMVCLKCGAIEKLDLGKLSSKPPAARHKHD